MQLNAVLKKLIDETQINPEHYLKDESPNPSSPDPGPRPPRPPPPPPPDAEGPMDCSPWYIWAAIVVIILATITLVVILIYFCRRARDRRPSLETIITNIELQNSNEVRAAVVPTVVPNRNFHNIQLGDKPARITIIDKY